MVSNRALGIARKSAKRTRVVDAVMAALCGDQIFTTLDYRRKSEAYLKQYMHQPLQAAVRAICKDLFNGQAGATIRAKAQLALLWEGDVKTTINHILFLGAQHRPDFVVQLDGLRIAVEVKRGESGSAVREGIGQALVYAASEDFDFVTYLFIDTSRDKKIRRSVEQDLEGAFVASLWDRYNIRLRVV